MYGTRTCADPEQDPRAHESRGAGVHVRPQGIRPPYLNAPVSLYTVVSNISRAVADTCRRTDPSGDPYQTHRCRPQRTTTSQLSKWRRRCRRNCVCARPSPCSALWTTPVMALRLLLLCGLVGLLLRLMVQLGLVRHRCIGPSRRRARSSCTSCARSARVNTLRMHSKSTFLSLL